MNTSAPVVTSLGAIGVAVFLTTSCTTVTGGTALPQRAGVSASATGAAPSSGGPPTPAPSTKPSDQDEIRDTLMAFQDAYNTQNWDAYLELMCTAMRTQFSGTVLNYVKKTRAQNGVTTIKNIIRIAVTGDTADATFQAQNESMGTQTVSLPLKLEDGWKICKI
jgi:hypothetical protein